MVKELIFTGLVACGLIMTLNNMARRTVGTKWSSTIEYFIYIPIRMFVRLWKYPGIIHLYFEKRFVELWKLGEKIKIEEFMYQVKLVTSGKKVIRFPTHAECRARVSKILSEKVLPRPDFEHDEWLSRTSEEDLKSDFYMMKACEEYGKRRRGKENEEKRSMEKKEESSRAKRA